MAFVPDWVGLVLLVIIVLIGGIYTYLKNVSYNYWTKRGVAQVEAEMLVGCMRPIFKREKCFGTLFADLYEKMKSHRAFGVYTLFRPNLVVADPELIRHVMTKDFASFQDRGIYCNEKVDPLSGHLFLLSGSRWKNLRVKLSPTFSSGKIKHMFMTVKECGDQLAEAVKNSAKAGEVLDVKDFMARFSTDVIASAAFGIQCNSLKNPDSEFRYWGRKIFSPKPFKSMCAVFLPAVMNFFGIPSNDRDVSNFFINVFNENVAYRKANNVSRKDFMQLVMQLMNTGRLEDEDGKAKAQTSEKVDVKLTALEGAAQSFVFFFAGFETSSSTVTHCLYELALNPDIQEKLREDIDQGLEKFGGELTYDCLAEMTYLNKVVNETLRKYPSVPLLNRICTEEFELPGTNIRVPKGMPITIPVLGIQWDPEIYPDPDRFDPERFSEEGVASRHTYTYLPFGEGPRLCIGMRFGLVQTKVALISLLAKYRFKPGPETTSPLIFDPSSFVLAPKDGINLRIELR